MATIKDLLSKMIEKTNENTSEITGLKENGISCGADWNQNDENAKDYITNKPFGEKTVMGDTLTWDGNTEGLTIINDNMPVMEYLISSIPPTLEQLKNGVTVVQKNFNGEEIYKYTLSYEEMMNYYNATEDVFRLDKVQIQMSDYHFTYSVTVDGEEVYVEAVNPKGISAVIDYEFEEYIAEIQIHGAELFPTTEINHLDPKYIKDMYYTSDPVETPIVEETTFELVDGMGQLTAAQPLEVGQEYVINLDGTTHNCVCKMLEEFGLPYIGNAMLIDSGEDTGESLFIAPMMSDTELGIIVNSDVAEHTISVVRTISEVYKIDEKYIPDSLKKSIDEKAGLKVEGTVYTINDKEVTASVGAEVFNIYKKNADGDENIASGDYSHAEGLNTIANGHRSHAEGYGTTASGWDSHAEGSRTTASGNSSHAEGTSTTASGNSSHAEGSRTTASGNSSHAEGTSTTASGNSSHAEGKDTTASGEKSHAEGYNTTASGDCSHAEGTSTEASGNWSHAEGFNTTASGLESHAEGNNTTASGDFGSHSEGYYTIASGEYQHVQGKWNIEDTEDAYAHIVGNGESEDARSNAHTLDWEGNAWYQGTVEGTAMIVKSSTEGSSKRFKITVDDSGTISAVEI